MFLYDKSVTLCGLPLLCLLRLGILYVFELVIYVFFVTICTRILVKGTKGR